ncbi:MAG: SRPBCC family protein, partial [Kofleriaceae bacterium]
VFAELADPVRWLDWFPLMRRAEWTSREKSAVGAERQVGLRVFGEFRERMIAWEPGKRFAFTMTASTSPLTARMAEDWRLSREGSTTRLDWIVGAFPTTIGKLGAPALRFTLTRMFRQGGSNLRRLLRQRGTQVA